MGRFRIANHTENVYGYVEPFMCQPCLVILLTDGGDELPLVVLQQLIREGKMLQRHDSQLHIIRICPPGRLEKNINFESLRKFIEKDRNSRTLMDIAEALGGGLHLINRFEEGQEILFAIINRFRPRLALKFQHMSLNLFPQYFKESGIVFQHSAPWYLRDGQFMAYHGLTGEYRMSRIPLPCRPPRTQSSKEGLGSSKHEIQVTDQPELIVDFGRVFDMRMSPHMPFEKLVLEECHQFSEVRQKLKHQKAYFPVFAASFEGNNRALIGMLKVQKQQESSELFLYLANFVDFSPYFDMIICGRPLTREVQITLSDYLKSLPPIYDRYIAAVFAERGYQRQFMLRIPDKVRLNEVLEKAQQVSRKTAAEEFKSNLKAHAEYTATCCPIYSPDYALWSKQSSKFKETPQVRNLNASLENMLKLKKELFPQDYDVICLPQSELKPVVKSLSYSFSMEVSQNMQNMRNLGNPFRRHIVVERDESVMPSKKEKQPKTAKPEKFTQQPQDQQQQAITNLCSRYAIRRPVQMSFNGIHLALKTAERNIQILQKILQ